MTESAHDQRKRALFEPKSTSAPVRRLFQLCITMPVHNAKHHFLESRFPELKIIEIRGKEIKPKCSLTIGKKTREKDLRENFKILEK